MIINGFQPLTITTLDVAAALDPPLVPTELGYVLNVILNRKENVALKMLLYKRAKAQLI